MTCHFVRRFYALSLIALSVATIVILTAPASLAQVMGTVQPGAESSAATSTISRARAEHPLAPGIVNDQRAPAGSAVRQKAHAAARRPLNDSLFQPVVLYDSAEYDGYYSVAVADVNGDGKPDVVVAYQGSGSDGSVEVLLGNGDGTFQAPVSYDSGASMAYSVAIADVNGDGKPDLVVGNGCSPSNCSEGSVGVLLGNGDGTFQAAKTFSSGGFNYYHSHVVIADVNGDGKLDLLVLNPCATSCDAGSPTEGSIGVLLGNGDGTFRSPVSYMSGGYASGVAVADVNDDGKPDLIVSNFCAIGSGCPGYPTTKGSVGILLGNGNGTFQPVVVYDSGGDGASSVAVADVNGDGKPDLLVGHCGYEACSPGYAGGLVGVLLGNGDGTFQPVVTYAAAGSVMSVVIADVNQDGRLDAVVANWGPTSFNQVDGTLGILLGNGDGTFQPIMTFDSGAAYSDSVAVADLNGDGSPDAVVANYCEYGALGCVASGESSLGVLLNNAEPSTTTALASSMNPSTYGQTVTFTATVNSASGTPTGTVIFYDSSTSIGGVTLTSGTAMLATSSLAAGSHSITAAYQGSSSFAPSTSTVLTQVVNGTSIATTTTLATSKNPGIYQQPVTFTATVTSASGIPTGTVVFFEDTKHAMGSATLVNGVASFTISSLKRDKYAITAAYQGSGNFQPSTSGVLEEWINLSGLFQSHTVERGSGSPSLVGQAVTFTAYVRSRYGLIPDGDLVVFATGDGVLLGTGTTQNGAASITTSSLRAGVLTVFAYYEGDDDFHSSSTHQIQTVDKDPTTTSITASPNPAVYGQAITYTATVTSSYGTPTGTVRISDIGLVPLVNEVATITKNLVRAGTHDITAAYQSDSDFARSTSAVYKEVVTPASTTTAIASSANPSSLGQTVTFTATVTSSAGVNPFGTATFTAGGTTLGTVALKDGVASVSTASLPKGSTVITATYNGADSFTGSSGSLTQVVQ